MISIEIRNERGGPVCFVLMVMTVGLNCVFVVSSCFVAFAFWWCDRWVGRVRLCVGEVCLVVSK